MLSMENELLSFETSFLKGSLAEYRQRAQRAEQRAQRAEATQRQLEQQLGDARKNTISPDERARLKLAYKDLVLLLNRISKSPIGRVLRQRPAFRELESRYLE